MTDSKLHMGQIMAECDCLFRDDCILRGYCIAERMADDFDNEEPGSGVILWMLAICIFMIAGAVLAILWRLIS